ncbi:MAG: hypothetical protein H0X64_00995 [Gemmatimonadaceae bacterium]|nr:hypothetical protein [Gemmatimonadaceae bacterium]
MGWDLPFYELLGFELVDTDRCIPIGWCRMHCEGSAVMLLRAEEPVNPEHQPVLFYMYTADLPALREHLISNHIEVSAIQYPDHGPSGEVSLNDPDGYRLGIVHWGEKEHSEWLMRIGRASV